MAELDDIRNAADDVADNTFALVKVADEGLKGLTSGLERVAGGVEAFREMMPLIAAAASAATSPLVERLEGFRGADGADGKDGRSIFSGQGVPVADFGQSGDLYLDVLSGDVWQQS